MKSISTDGYKVQFHSIRGASNRELRLIHSAAIHLENCVTSEQFRQLILNAETHHTKGMTNAQIYEMILAGGDMFGQPDGDLDITLTIYTKRWSKVIGYTYPNTPRTWINRKFLNNEWTMAGNFLHEGIHKMGFSDGPTGNDRRSVPYVCGHAVTYLTKKVITEGYVLTPIINPEVI